MSGQNKIPLEITDEYARQLGYLKQQLSGLKARQMGRVLMDFMLTPFNDGKVSIQSPLEAGALQTLIRLEDMRLAILESIHEDNKEQDNGSEENGSGRGATSQGNQENGPPDEKPRGS